MRLLMTFAMLSYLAASTVAASAQGWCAIVVRERALVRCGYSSLAKCKQNIGDKNKAAFCVPDPFFSSRRRDSHDG
jgi:hypothetical protein